MSARPSQNSSLALSPRAAVPEHVDTGRQRLEALSTRVCPACKAGVRVAGLHGGRGAVSRDRPRKICHLLDENVLRRELCGAGFVIEHVARYSLPWEPPDLLRHRGASLTQPLPPR